MTQIYMVTTGTCSDYRIEAVFSTREKAEKHKAGLRGARVEEWLLDICASEWYRTAVNEWNK